MITKGGYSMVDCSGLDLTKGSTEQTITGLFKKVGKAIKGKRLILAENCNWGGKYMTPISCFALNYSDNLIIATASTLQIHITNEDVVTIVNLAPEE